MKILIIQLAKIGDILQSRKLISSYASHEVHLLHNSIFTEFAEQMDLTRLIPVNLDQLQTDNSTERAEILSTLRAEKYDLVVNLNSHDFISNILPELNASACIGFNSGDEYSENWLRFIMSFLKSRKLSGFNLMDIYGWVNKDYHPVKLGEIKIPASPEKVVIQLGTRNIKRQWSIAEYAVLTDWFVKQGAKVFLTGTAAEKEMSCELLKTSSVKFNIIDMTGKTSVPALFNLIENSDLLISGDTGTMHIGAFFEVPTIALFLGPAFPHETLSDSAVVTFPDSNIYDCYPCKEQDGCPFELKCRAFTSAIKIIEFIQDTETDNWYYSTSDSAGQLLKAYKQAEPDETSLMREVYRYIAKAELLNCIINDKLNIDKSTENYRNLAFSTERELQILKHLIVNKIKDFKFLNSLKYLKPLYLNYLLEKNSSDFVNNAIRIIESVF